MKQAELARKHLDDRLTSLRESAELVRPPRGWVRAIRDALGMTTGQLAKRIGVDQSRINQLERAEVEGSVTLKTLRQVAEGLGCSLVYAFVPNPSLDGLVRARAEEIADRELARAHHTMRLENQALTQRDLKQERARLVTALLTGNPRRLWDEP
jgi:predicted DNA-binding mobile mystery protein A